jgi:hypothetical protein
MSVTTQTIDFLNDQINWFSFSSTTDPMSINYCIDVDNDNLTDNDVLSYNPSNAKWQNKALSALKVTSYSNADGGYYYETYVGIAGKVDGGTV